MSVEFWLRTGERIPGMEWTKAMHAGAVAVQKVADKDDCMVTMLAGAYVIAALPGHGIPDWVDAIEGTSLQPEPSA